MQLFDNWIFMFGLISIQSNKRVYETLSPNILHIGNILNISNITNLRYLSSALPWIFIKMFRAAEITIHNRDVSRNRWKIKQAFLDDIHFLNFMLKVYLILHT